MRREMGHHHWQGRHHPRPFWPGIMGFVLLVLLLKGLGGFLFWPLALIMTFWLIKGLVGACRSDHWRDAHKRKHDDDLIIYTEKRKNDDDRRFARTENGDYVEII